MLKSNFCTFKNNFCKSKLNFNAFKSIKNFAAKVKFNYEDPLDFKSLNTEEETMVKAYLKFQIFLDYGVCKRILSKATFSKNIKGK